MTTTPTLNLALGSDTGVSHTDGITSDTSPVITGTAQPFATVALSDANGTLGLTTRADKNGNFIFFATGLTAGTHALTALAEDAAGNFSAPSAALNLDIQTDATATSIPATDPDPATATSVVFKLHFAQPVSTLSATSFVLATTGTAYGNVAFVTGSGEDFSVTVNGLGGDGTVGLAFSAQGPTDLAGNQVALTSVAHPVADTTNPTTTLVTSDRFGVPGHGATPAISGGGRLVAFISDDTQLTPLTQTEAGIGNVYVKDLQTGAIALVTNGNDQADDVQISLEGTVVAFSSLATNLVPGGTPEGELNLYVARLTSANSAGGLSFVPGSITRVAVLNSDIADGLNLNTFALSGDGSTLAFGTDTQLPDGSGSGTNDNYFYNLATGAYSMIPGANVGQITSISRDGTVVAYTGPIVVPGTGGQPDPYTGGTYKPNVVQDAVVYSTVTKLATIIDGTGLLGTVAPTGPGQVATYATADAVLSGDGKSLVFELQRGNNLSSLYRVVLTNPGTDIAVSPGAATDGAGEFDDDPSLSSGGSVIAYQDANNAQAVLYSTATGGRTTLGPALETVLTTQGNAVAVVEPTDASGTSDAIYEISLGVSASISPIDGNDTLDKIALTQAAAAGLVVSGTSNAAPGSKVVLEINAANTAAYSDPVTTTVGDDGQWTATLPANLFNPATLPDGAYFVNAQVAGPAGASPSVARLFVVDTVAPATPGTPVLDSGSNTGPTRDGKDTDTATPTVDGTAEPGATVLLYDSASGGGAAIATATVDQNGIYTLTAKPLQDGAHKLTVVALDAAGNSSAPSAALAINVDTTVPDTPPAPFLQGKTGTNAPQSTDDATPALTGDADANSFVTVYTNNGSLALGTVRAGSDGSYSITLPKLADGDYQLAVRATDLAGNVSGLSSALALTVDTQAPSTPVIGAITGQTQPDGSYTSFDVTGSAASGTTVTLQVDGVTVQDETATTRNSGAYDIAVPDLNSGTHTISVFATDAAGNVSQSSAPMTVTISSSGSAPPSGTPTVSGVGEDGPIAGATVFADLNGNGVPDAGEPATITDASGRFTLAATGADALGLTGGVDTVAGVAPDGTLVAPAGSTVIDPLTTFLAAYAAATGQDAAAALPGAVAALGLAAGIDLRTYDVRIAAANGTTAADVASTTLMDDATLFATALHTAGATLPAGFAAAFAAFAAQAASNGGAIDFTDFTTLDNVLAAAAAALAVSVPAPLATDTADMATDVSRELANGGDAYTSGLAFIDEVSRVEQAQAAPALAAAGTDATAVSAVQGEYGGDLGNAVATAELALLTAPVLAPGSDTGVSAGDNVTIRDPVFVGEATPYAAVLLIDIGPVQSVVVGAGVANASGRYAIQATLSSGLNTLAAVLAPAGQSTAVGAAYTEVGGEPPPTSLTQVLAGGAIVNDGSGPVIQGAFYVSEPGDDATHASLVVRGETDTSRTVLVDIYADGGATPVGSAYAAEDFSILIAPLGNGPHTLVVTETYFDGQTTNNVGSAAASSPFAVTVSAPVPVTETGYANGAIIAAAVYTGEPGSETGTDRGPNALATTGADGTFTLPAGSPLDVPGSATPPTPDQPVVLYGGLDTATNLPVPMDLSAPNGSQAVNPLTTVLAFSINGLTTPGTLATSAQDLDIKLGLPAGTDVTTLDPLALAEAGDPLPFVRAAEILVSAELLAPFVQSPFTELTLLLAGPVTAGVQQVNLTDPSFWLAELNTASANLRTNLYPSSDGIFEQAATLIAAADAAIEQHAQTAASPEDLVDFTLAVEREVQQTEAPALAGPAAAGDAAAQAATDFNTLVTEYTGAGLQSAVAAALAQLLEVTSFTPDGAGLADGTLGFTLTFSQPVGGLGAADFTVATTGSLQGVHVTGATPVAGSNGTAWNVAVAAGIGAGNVTLTFTGAGVTRPDGSTFATGQFGNPVTTASTALDGTSNAVSSVPQALTLGDFNGDGRVDIAAVGVGGLTIYLNEGDGTFQAENQIYTGGSYNNEISEPFSSANAVATGDFNGDGKLDVVTGSRIDGIVSVLLGNGDGTFGAAREIAADGGVQGIATGDLNGDGKTDLLVASETNNNLGIITPYLGQGDGTFIAGTPLDLPGFSESLPRTVDLVDLNGDGKLDIVASDFENGYADGITVFLGNGDGTFRTGVTLPVGLGEGPVAVGDLNGDGIPDIVTGQSFEQLANGATQAASIEVFLGKGDGTFAPPTSFALPTSLPNLGAAELQVDALAISDLNGDGRPDLVVQAGPDQGTLRPDAFELLGTGGGAFAPATLLNPEPNNVVNPYLLALADVNGDGLPDMITDGAIADGAVSTGSDDESAGSTYGIDAFLNSPATVLPASATAPVSRAAAAQPILQQTGGPGTLTESGQAYTLDLGQVAQGSSLGSLLFALANTAGSGSDSFDGTFAALGGSGFVVAGADLPDAVAPGQAYSGLSFAADTSTAGAHSVTLTFAPRDLTNDPGTTLAGGVDGDPSSVTLAPADADGNDVSLELAPITLTITDDVVPGTGLPPAALGINASPVALPPARVGEVETVGLGVTNTAVEGSAALDVTATATGDATIAGSITALAPGAEDDTSLQVTLGTASAGRQSGTVTLHPASDGGGALTDASVAVSGSVYRPGAAGTIAPVDAIVHVGDPGTFALPVTNTDPADGFSEALDARVTDTTGPVDADGAATVAPGATDSTLSVTVSTATAGVEAGNVLVSLATDGGTGEGSIDGLGTLALAPATVPVSITVDNYAAPSLSATVDGMAAAITGGVLNLGTLQLGSTPAVVALTEANAAAGPADLLAASLASSGGTGFTNALGSVSALAAGQSAGAGTVTLATGMVGVFTETVSTSAVGSNAGGYSGAVAAGTLTITGTVVASTGATPPAAPTVALVSPADGSLAAKAITDTPTPAVAGATSTGVTVGVLAAGATVGSTVANTSSGAYTDTLATGLPLGLSALSASASNSTATTAGTQTASAYTLPAPVNGVSTADLASIDIGRLLDGGFVFQLTPGTEAVNLLDGVLSVGPDTNQAYVQRLYEGLFGRGDDIGGMSHWIGVLAAGGSKEDVANGFLNAPEFLQDYGTASAIAPQQFITMLYQGILGRAPTAGDLSFWNSEIQQYGQAAVLQGIADSPEAKAHNAAATAQVWAPTVLGTLNQELYGTGLGREAEPAGNAYWQGILPGVLTAQAVSLFIATPEFQSLHAAQDPATFVKSLFDAGLGRDPTGTEAEPLVAGLQNGTLNQAAVLVKVATSPGAAAYVTRNLNSTSPGAAIVQSSDVFTGSSTTPTGYAFKG